MTRLFDQDGTGTVDEEEVKRRERVAQIVERELGAPVRITYLDDFADGFTGARVTRCDLMGNGQARLEGEYILKVSDDPNDGQNEAHRLFTERLTPFAERRVPALELSGHDDQLRVDIYSVAGETRGVRPARVATTSVSIDALPEVSRELLEAQFANHAGGESMTVRQTLEAWLGEGFLSGKKGEALRETRRLAGIAGTTFAFSTQMLPDPLSVLEQDNKLSEDVKFVLLGYNHGDLHPRNILLDGAGADEVTYWLIDIDWDRYAPLLYDHAYLETATLLVGQELLRKQLPLEVLRECDDRDPRRAGPLEWEGNVRLVESIRRGKDEAVEALQPTRKGSLRHQYLVARLGAALNYAAKRRSPEQQRVTAYRLAGWVAHLLLTEYHPTLLARVLADAHTPQTVAPNGAVAAVGTRMTADGRGAVEEMAEQVKPFVADTHNGFDRFLIVENGVTHQDLAHLPDHRWSVIIDLNPDSETNGLAHGFDPGTAENQIVVSGLHDAPTPGRNTVSWLMAGGRESLGEHAPPDFRSWRSAYQDVVRDVLARHSTNSVNRAAAVMCLTAGDKPDQRAERVLEFIDDLYEPPMKVLRASPDDGRFEALLSVFAESGALPRPERLATLPGAKGPTRFSRPWLAGLEADLVVLHSQILDEELRDEAVDAFWRGRPANWLDLDAGQDVPRSLQPPLQAAIADVLERQSSASFELFHAPGAGGTTLARRIAWDLHREHPVLLLRHYSPDTVERIDSVYRFTERSLVLVAESADMGQSEREDLYRKLNERNTPVVVLWVTRSNGPASDDEDGRANSVKYHLTEPMTREEAREFRASFGARARSPKAKASVEALVPYQVPDQQVSPFYFGLCAFETEFLGTARYVESHVRQFTEEQRRLAAYLALVTRYGQIGLPYSLVRRWITGHWGGEAASLAEYRADLEKVLGADLRRLVVEDGQQLRILHPSIADTLLEVLLEAKSGEARWPSRLANTAIEFIGQLVGHLGPDNAQTRSILENLFIRRNRSGSGTQQFAELIRAFGTGQQPGREQAYRIFQELTRRCPDEPHYWLHLARYHLDFKKHEDGQAEKFINRAIELSKELDPVQFHALGMLHREWVYAGLRQFRNGTGRQAETIEHVRNRYDAALSVFARASKLKPSDEHNYVSAVQMIVRVLNKLVAVSPYKSLVDLVAAGGDDGKWADAQLGMALSLLDECESARPDSADSSYLQRCREDIETAHGEIETMVRAWRDVIVNSRGYSGLALVLARKFLQEQGQNWEETPNEVFQTVVELFDAAFEDRGDLPDHDVELWFRCYRRLPEYDDLAALERLSTIAGSRTSPVCTYYLYVVHFLRWLNQEEYSQDEALRRYDEATHLNHGRSRRWNYEWVAKGLSDGHTAARLANFRELGEYRPLSRDWQFSERVCRRVRGVVRQIDGQRSGWVAVEDGEMKAFFVPREDFTNFAHRGKVVEFDLGFAHDGLRAWRVELAKDQKLFRNAGARLPEVAVSPVPLPSQSGAAQASVQVGSAVRVPSPSAAPHPRPAVVTPEIRQEAHRRAEADGPEAAGRFIVDYLLSAATGQHAVTSFQVGKALTDTLGKEKYLQLRAGASLGALMERLGFAVRPTANGQFVVEPEPTA
ncbi:hypothetical protein [Streptomyces viridosporus]|uniref:hypothetical protein n=1 Tax=Streptomyces viridosporus TaxID=67581 RepID=UPI0009BE64F9|nr:hypothetical protein [Streptomyces viridosporus]